MIKKSAIRSALAAGVALGALPAAAWAQDPAADVNADGAILVTGLRQQYRGDVPIKDIPQSIQVIDSKVLNDLNVTRLDSALDLASGIARQNNFGGLWDAFAVRGFAGDENFPSGFLVNGFNGGRGYGGPRDASNIDRIEVLKGPNGAVFGRGEPGGTVNIITKKATVDGSFGSFGVSAGSFDTFRVEGDFNLAISDQVALRINGASEQADSFRDTIKTQKYVLSPSVLLKLSDATSLTYELEFVDQEVPFDRGVVAVNGKLGVIPRSRFLGEPGDGPTHVQVLGHQAQLQQDLGGNDWVLIVGFGYRDTSFKGFSSDAELALGRQTLDNDGQNLARQRRLRDYNTTNTVARAEVSGKIETGPLIHHVLVGADWDRFEIDTVQLRVRPANYTAGSPITVANNAINIFNPVYGQLPVPGAFQNSLEIQKAWGIYFQDQIDIGERIKLRFGGRFDHFRKDFTNRLPNGSSPPGSTKERFSPTAGILFELTDALSIYGGYGTGFRPNSGISAPTPACGPAGCLFEPETSKSYEAGLRYTAPGNRITATLAAYTMTKNNILTADPGNAGFSIAVGEARSRGIEADVNARLPGDVTIMATYAYTDAEWSSSARDPNFAALIRVGDPLINIPKHAASLLATKGFEIGETGKFTIGVGVNYVGKRLGETATAFYLPGYTLVRALASYEPTEQIRIGVDVTNLFDKTYYASSYSQFWVQPGTPRTITGRVTFKF